MYEGVKLQGRTTNPRVVAEPVAASAPAPAAPAPAARSPFAPAGVAIPSGAMRATLSARIPQGLGLGRAGQQESIFRERGEVKGPPAGAQQVKLVQGPIPTSRQETVKRTMLGQASPTASSGAVADYPAIDRVLEHQMTGLAFTRAEAGAILDALDAALVRISAPENTGSACVRALPPGLVEKAGGLKTKLSQFVSSGAGDSFKDFSASDLEGADRVIACAGELTKAATNSGSALAWIALIAAAAGIAYLMQKKMQGK